MLYQKVGATLCEQERTLVVEILNHLAEVDRTRAYIEGGFPSLWEYCLRALKFSESATYQRISAMRAIQANPELAEKIRSGVLNISSVCQIQSVLKAEREQAQRTYSRAQRADLFRKCESKSTKDVTRELIAFSPLAMKVQRERVISEDRTEISFIVDPPLFEKIRRVRDLSVAKLNAPASYPELVDLMSEWALDKIDPLRKSPREPKVAKASTADASTSRAVSKSLRTKVWKDFEGRCGFVSLETGVRCSSTFGLEIEHCKPHALGGSSTDLENLKLLCKKHNQWQAIQTYGMEKMDRYLNSPLDDDSLESVTSIEPISPRQ